MILAGEKEMVLKQETQKKQRIIKNSSILYFNDFLRIFIVKFYNNLI